MKKVIITLIAVLSVFYSNGQGVAEVTEDFVENVQGAIEVKWQETFEQAVAKAKMEDKPILIYFTGSDWCGPCINLDKNLFHTEKFAAFSDENLVLYTADYPRNRDLVSKENKQANKQLSKKYSQTSFPTMIVIDKNGNVLGRKNGTYMLDYYYPFFEETVRGYK